MEDKKKEITKDSLYVKGKWKKKRKKTGKKTFQIVDVEVELEGHWNSDSRTFWPNIYPCHFLKQIIKFPL